MKASRLQNMTEEKYYRIITGKTGSLLVACCECGAISASAEPEVRRRMQKIGHHIGLAFQIRDDLLDYSSRKTDKSSGNDIIERKITLPFVAALESSGMVESQKMRWIYRKKKKTVADIRRIKTFVEENNGLTYARNKMEEHAREALILLNEFPDSETRQLFSEFIRFVIYRKK